MAWLVQPGDAVREDQPLIELMTDKATVTITAPRAGTVLETHGRLGEVVAVHSVLVVFEVGEPARLRPPRRLPGRCPAATVGLGSHQWAQDGRRRRLPRGDRRERLRAGESPAFPTPARFRWRLPPPAGTPASWGSTSGASRPRVRRGVSRETTSTPTPARAPLALRRAPGARPCRKTWPPSRTSKPRRPPSRGPSRRHARGPRRDAVGRRRPRSASPSWE